MERIEEYTSVVRAFLAPFEGYSFFGNTGADYLMAVVLALFSGVVFAFLQWGIIARLKKLSEKTSTDIDDTLINIVASIQPSFYWFVALYIGVQTLALPDLAHKAISALLLVWVAVQVVLAVQSLIDYIAERRARKESDEGSRAAFQYLTTIVKWLLWVLAALAILANLGVDITSALAGLGIMGIAVGFALQNILADLFSSFTIYFDKPFQIGDYIVVGEHSGTVEKIGIKTTRLRTLQGEELVMSNQELTSARVQNFRKLEERRVSFHIGVLYETPHEKVKRIPEMVQNIIENIPKVRFDRVHFDSLGDSALIFEIVYYVLSDQYIDKMDVQQAINFALVERFEKEGIGFAYPTQTIYMHKG